MVDVKTIEAMYTSLWRGYKDYKFSQLRSALKEYDVTDLDSLKLNIKTDREALLKIAEKFLMDALNIGDNLQENEYPDIPLTYGWQFEGIENSEDCFLHPTTPLSCDVLSGQYCELVVSNKGFNEIKPIQTDDCDYTDLPMVINLVVASIANRKQSKISHREAVGLLQQLCPFFNDIRQLENLSEALRQDDELYRVLCKDMLSEARKQALTNPFELPDFIRECTEVKSMINARASKDPSIKLINDWLHPLSEVKEDIPGTEGQPYCNVWQFASLIVGAATRRCPNTDAHGAITILVDFDVIESEKSVEIEQAKSDDAVYLQLVGAMKEAFDLDFERQIKNQKA